MGIREFMCRFVPYLDLIWRGPSIQLHGDLVLRQLLHELANRQLVKAVVETGTYRGDSTFLFHEIFTSQPIYSIDINPIYHSVTRWCARNLPRMHFLKGDAKVVLPRMITEKTLGDDALFWLDAHWGNFWPLETEIEAITHKLNRAIIMIDDFRVPERDEFGYDLGSGRYDKRPCDFNLICSCMSRERTYRLLYPNYEKQDALRDGTPHRGALRGYVVIFQNMDAAFRQLAETDFVQRNYRVVSNDIGQVPSLNPDCA
jgi:hypothetical protein